MSFCKICSCGEKVVFERRLSFPDNCPSCGRRLVDFLTYNVDDPKVQELLNCAAETGSSEEEEAPASDSYSPQTTKYALQFVSGAEIIIPDEGGIIGRTEIGAELLSDYPSVSRKHIRVIPRRNLGVIIEDMSSYGTLVDGKRIDKNVPTRVTEKSTITLCNLELNLIVKEG